MANYHIARSGKVARCKAAPGSCPLGGKHFANKEIADFYKDTQVDLASTRSVQTILREMPDEWLAERLGAVTRLNNWNHLGNKSEARALERKMRKMFNGYTPEDKTWDEATLRKEKARRVKAEDERDWAAIVKGSKDVDKLSLEEIEMRIDKLGPLESYVNTGDHEGATRYMSLLKSKYGFDADDRSWNPNMLKGARDLRLKKAA